MRERQYRRLFLYLRVDIDAQADRQKKNTKVVGVPLLPAKIYWVIFCAPDI